MLGKVRRMHLRDKLPPHESSERTGPSAQHAAQVGQDDQESRRRHRATSENRSAQAKRIARDA